MRPVRCAAALAGTVLLAVCGATSATSAASAPGTATTTGAAAPVVSARARAAVPAPALAGKPYASSIAPVSAAELSASWRAGCPVAPQRLRAVTITHVDFTGTPRTGRLVVRDDVAQAVADVFGDLYALRFPVERVEPVEAYGGSDDASMAANNTSAFNCRATTGGTSFSEHSHGTAIDLNPVQNPYVKGTTVLPAAGRAHLDRTPARGRITAGDPVVAAFAARGFTWGGDWRTLKDYQHFSLSGG